MSLKKRWGKKYQDKRDWKKYNEHLVNRGEFLLNPSFLETWNKELIEMNQNKIGQPYLYPQSMIVFLAILKSRGFDYRSLQGLSEHRQIAQNLGLRESYNPFI